MSELAVALAAVMLAAVNPCGFALLPAYLSMLVAGDSTMRRATAVGHALKLSAVMAGSFVAVFGVFGLVVSPLASSVQQQLPWVTVAIGVLLVGVGLWLLGGRRVRGLPLARAGTAPRVASVPAMAGYGASYALASLSCTIAPLLAVVVSSFRTDSVWQGAGLFAIYGVGMGLVVGTAAVAVAVAKTAVLARMRRFGAALPRLAGGLLVVVGAYVVYYRTWEIRVLRGDVGEDAVISVAEHLRGRLVAVVEGLGWLGVSAIMLAMLAFGVLGTRLGRRPVNTRTHEVDERDQKTPLA